MTKEQAEKAVDAILIDLCGRSGLQNEWDNIDEDIQEEIVGVWVEAIMSASKDT